MPEPKVASEGRYFVDPARRILELLPEGEIPDTAELKYSFFRGYERLDYRSSPSTGSYRYEGSYHPNSVCEGGGVCRFCGRTLHDE